MGCIFFFFYLLNLPGGPPSAVGIAGPAVGALSGLLRPVLGRSPAPRRPALVLTPGSSPPRSPPRSSIAPISSVGPPPGRSPSFCRRLQTKARCWMDQVARPSDRPTAKFRHERAPMYVVTAYDPLSHACWN